VSAGVVWQLECDRATGEHDEREGGVGAVESVGAVDDQLDLVVQAFVAAVGQSSLARKERRRRLRGPALKSRRTCAMASRAPGRRRDRCGTVPGSPMATEQVAGGSSPRPLPRSDNCALASGGSRRRRARRPEPGRRTYGHLARSAFRRAMSAGSRRGTIPCSAGPERPCRVGRLWPTQQV
jgi:hypothetical protein